MARPSWKRRALLAALVGALIVAAPFARDHLDVPLGIEDLRARVGALGWWGPAGLLVLMSLRQFLALPSALLLSVAGLCFSIPVATAIGTVGLVVSAVLSFVLARTMLRDAVARHEGSRARRLETLISRAGPAVIAISTAHPIGMLTPLHWAAGLSRLPLASFVVALVLGAPVRAFAYACLASTALSAGSDALVAGSIALLALSLVPLAIPRVRRRLFGGG